MMDKLKILIVEDDKTSQILYDNGLSEEIFEKRLVDNGEEALQVYGSWHPDIIILDIMIPLLSGYSVLREIRDEIGDKKTTIIMATSLSSRGDFMNCISFGIEGYIVKPFKPGEISSKILEYYQRKNPEGSKAVTIQHDGVSGEEAGG